MQYKTNVQELFFLLIYVIYLIAVLGELTVFSENDVYSMVFKAMRYLCYLLAVIKIVRDAYWKQQLWRAIFVFACVVCTVMASKNNVFGFYFLIILAAKDVNLRKIIKVTCLIQGIVLATCVGLSQIGVVRDYIFDPNARARHGLGFVWTTTAPILFFFFMMTYIYVRKERMHTLEFLILEVINCWMFIVTDARMSFYLSSLMLLLLFILRFFWQNRSDTNKRIRNGLLLVSPVVMCCIALYLHAGYDGLSEGWRALNALLSGRLELGYNGIQEYGITLFGQPIDWVGFSHGVSTADYNYVDCSYLQILLENGIIMLALIVLAYVYIMYIAVRSKDYYLQMIILFIVVFSITEPRLIHLGFNPFPFFVAGIFSGITRDTIFQLKKDWHPHIKWETMYVRLKMRK